jgi:hypothetical protein
MFLNSKSGDQGFSETEWFIEPLQMPEKERPRSQDTFPFLPVTGLAGSWKMSVGPELRALL